MTRPSRRCQRAGGWRPSGHGPAANTHAPTLARDRDWLQRHIGPDEFATVTDIGQALAMIPVMGPNARQLLQSLTDADLSAEAFPFGTSREIDIGCGFARATRITYVGELGWELLCPGATRLCCRCRCWWEAQLVAGPGDQMAAGTIGRGYLRASDADREHLIDRLKDAFALGQLTRDELVVRAGRALTSRTYAELAAITADIPAVLIQAQPYPQPARVPTRKPVKVKAVAWGAGLIIAPPSLWAVFLTYYGGFIFLLLAAFAGLVVTMPSTAPPSR